MKGIATNDVGIAKDGSPKVLYVNILSSAEYANALNTHTTFKTHFV